MENHHFSWINQPEMAMFNSYEGHLLQFAIENGPLIVDLPGKKGDVP